MFRSSRNSSFTKKLLYPKLTKLCSDCTLVLFRPCFPCCFAAVFIRKKTKTLNLSVQHFFVFKWLIVFLSNLWLCQPLQVTFGSYQAFRKAAAMPATATEHPILWSEQYRRFYDSKKKLTLKTYFFCEVKQLYLVQVFDFETVPALPRSSGPPRPSGKRRQRRQPRTYIKLSGQTSTKDLRSILLLHELDSKKIFTIMK